jgi:UDP-N-acetylmuramate--alanine ligase
MQKGIPKKIHFMGVGGSGLSAAALIAKKHGFEVTGCDLEQDTPYLAKVKKAGIKVYRGHDETHLEDSDHLVISPAIIFQNNNHPEYLEAKRKDKVLIWDEFLGRYILSKKTSVCIAGTHGKSTTTALAGIMFEKAGLDPNVLVGASVKEWISNSRTGESDIFIIEADEFYEKFLSYNAQFAVINNIEYDHPDYFNKEEDVLKSFDKFVKSIHGANTLIVNMDSAGIAKLSEISPQVWRRLNLYGYTLNGNKLDGKVNTFNGEILEITEKYTKFRIVSKDVEIDEIYTLSIPGVHNVYNAMGVIILAKLFNIKTDVIKKVLLSFQGIGRRMDLLGVVKDVKVYDDYAHHPTAIRETLKALRQKYPKNRIWAVIEPHSFSRTKALLAEFDGAFSPADKVIVAPVFKARDSHDFGISGEAVVKVSGHKDIIYIDSFEKIVEHLLGASKRGDVIFVMGAGKSYQLAKDIVTYLKNKK